MEADYEQLRTAVLALPAIARLHLADEIYKSVPVGAVETEDGFELTPEFKAELDRRMNDFTSGREHGIPWEQVQKEVDALLAGS